MKAKKFQLIPKHRMSKLELDALCKEASKNEKLSEELIYTVCFQKGVVAENAAWILSYFGKTWEIKLNNALPQLLEVIKNRNTTDSIKRNLLRLLREMKIKEEYLGPIFPICFQILTNANETVANRAFSMHVIRKQFLQYPALLQETCIYVEERMDIESPAFRSVGRKLLQICKKGVHFTG